MNKYLGEEILTGDTHPYYHNTKEDWIMLWIERYGYIDGAHHKQWLIDQILRLNLGGIVEVKKASWENGHYEYRFDIKEDDPRYNVWLKSYVHDEGVEWDQGIAP